MSMMSRRSLFRIGIRRRRLHDLGKTAILSLTLFGFLLSHIAIDFTPAAAEENETAAVGSCCSSRGSADGAHASRCCCNESRIAAGNCCCNRKGSSPAPAEKPEHPVFQSCPCGDFTGSVWLPTSQPRMTVSYFSAGRIEPASITAIPLRTCPAAPVFEPVTPPPELFLLG